MIMQQKELAERLRAIRAGDTSRAVTFLLGSALSRGAIADVRSMTVAIKKSFAATDGAAGLEDHLAMIGAEDHGSRYRAAFNYLVAVRGPDAADRIVRLAVLQAYIKERDETLSLSADQLQKYESRIDRWAVTQPIRQLAAYLASLPSDRRGVILTTNFDPLLEVALAQLGLTALPISLSDDRGYSALNSPGSAIPIVHLHGYWRFPNTMNQDEQLAQSRPQLARDVMDTLQRQTVVILGYGGWDDLIRAAISQAEAERRTSDFDVAWAINDTPDMALPPVPAQLTRAAPGRAMVYYNVDVDTLFSEVVDLSTARVPLPRQRPGTALPRGWLLADQALEQVASLIPPSDSRLAFYNGRQPSWLDAVDPVIPLRAIDVELSAAVQRWSQRRLALHLAVYGATGEGKSLGLLRLAKKCAELPDVSVIWRRVTDFPTDPLDWISQATAERALVVIVDNADDCIPTIKVLLDHLYEQPHLSCLLVTGSHAPFTYGRQVVDTQRFAVRGLSGVDARALVEGWGKDGDEALGELATLPVEDRAARLLDAASSSTARGGSTLFGAMLAVRESQQFRGHIENLIGRLAQLPVGTDQSNLAEMLVLIACADSKESWTLTRKQLAVASQLHLWEIDSQILAPLGEEAAISVEGTTVRTRHPMICDEIMEVATERGLIGPILTQTARRAAVFVATHGYEDAIHPLLYLNRHFEDPALGVELARATWTGHPRRISYLTAFSSALRSAGEADEARILLREQAAALVEMEDFGTGHIYFLQELGVTLDVLGDHPSALALDVMALSKALGGQPVTWPTVSRILFTVASAARGCYKITRRDLFLSASHLAAEAGLAVGASDTKARNLLDIRDWAVREGARPQFHAETAASIIRRAGRSAYDMIEEPLVRRMVSTYSNMDVLTRRLLAVDVSTAGPASRGGAFSWDSP